MYLVLDIDGTLLHEIWVGIGLMHDRQLDVLLLLDPFHPVHFAFSPANKQRHSGVEDVLVVGEPKRVLGMFIMFEVDEGIRPFEGGVHLGHDGNQGPELAEDLGQLHPQLVFR